MRSLKFRAWDKDLCKYLEGCEISSLMADFDAEGDGREIIIKQICPARYIFEQYTGLKDKNGKEIYEGDIVRFYYKGKIVGDFKVKYDEEVAWFLGENLVKNEDGVKTEESFFLSEYQSVRVTGNIHENKYLIGCEE